MSVPRHHIPSEQWEWEYGPAENDPEFGPSAAASPKKVKNESLLAAKPLNKKTTFNDDGDAEESANAAASSSGDEGEEGKPEEMGRWVHHLTGEPLGGPSRRIQFTVIGLTVANEMLSLVGSLQPDPFSSDHVPVPVPDSMSHVAGRRGPSEPTSSPEPVVERLARGVDRMDVDDGEDESENDNMDTFQRLGRQADRAEAAARQKDLEQRTRKEEEEEKERGERRERKRKRKEEKDRIKSVKLEVEHEDKTGEVHKDEGMERKKKKPKKEKKAKDQT